MSYWAWFGPMCREERALQGGAVSLAALAWQTGLLSAVRQHGVDVELVSILPEPAWPRGPLAPSPPEDSDVCGVPVRQIRNINLPGLRGSLAGRRFIAAFTELVRRRGRPAAVFTYNIARATMMVGRFAQATLGVPWIAVVADAPATPWQRRRHDAWLSLANGRVFLSWALYQKAFAGPSYHLDGGVGSKRPSSAVRPASFLFAGSLSAYNGLGLLLDAFRQVRSDQAALWICGKGDTDAVRRAAAADRRIEVIGLVTSERLNEIASRAYAFVSPRPPAMNEDNFPSKILEYLRYGKPIVSTWTGGLSPEYRNILVVAEGPSSGDFANALDRTLCLQPDDLAAIESRIGKFVSEHSWTRQAKRLIDWTRNTGGTEKRGAAFAASGGLGTV